MTITAVYTENLTVPSSGTQVTDRGWIGQTADASTGLQYLNARYYDPTTGRFTATDPITDLRQPASLDAYGYGHGSPVTLRDPTGLWVPVGSDRRAGSYEARRPRNIDTSTNRTTRLRLPGHRYRTVRPLREQNATGDDSVGQHVSQDIIDEILDAAADLPIELPKGACFEATASAGAAGAYARCLVALDGQIGFLEAVGLGGGTAGGTVELSGLFTNAKELNRLVGTSACISGSIGAAPTIGATVCGGLRLTQSGGIVGFNGIVTASPALGLAAQPGGSGTVLVTETSVDVVFSIEALRAAIDSSLDANRAGTPCCVLLFP